MTDPAGRENGGGGGVIGRLDPEARALVQAARGLAAVADVTEVSGGYVLLGALQEPATWMRARAEQYGLQVSQLKSQLEDLLHHIRPEADAATAFWDAVKSRAAEAGFVDLPALIGAALARPDGPTRKWMDNLERGAPGLVGTLQARVRPPSPTDRLGPEALSPRAAAILRLAGLLAQGREVAVLHLVRALVSDRGSLLSRGAETQRMRDSLLGVVGGEAPRRRPTGEGIPLGQCNAEAMGVMRRALELGTERGEGRIDEVALTLAIVEAAAEFSYSELVTAGLNIRALLQWARSQPPVEAPSRLVPVGDIRSYLQQRVINQDEAITAVCRPIRRLREGLSYENGLPDVFLFVGPPGVGKSYLAQLMARVLYDFDPEQPEAHLVMIECGRYKGEHEVTALIGAAPGYVGMDAGILVNGVRDRAPCVIVFDEAERMPTTIWDSVLTMLNDGVLRVYSGETYSLEGCVVVLTSNAGIHQAEDYRNRVLHGDLKGALAATADARTELGRSEAASRPLQRALTVDEFFSDAEHRDNYRDILLCAARRHFGPSMYSRIDEKIGFNGLRRSDYEQITRQNLERFTSDLERKTGVRLIYDDDVPATIAGEILLSTIDPSARDVSRFIRKHILDSAYVPIHGRSGSGTCYRVVPVMEGRGDKRTLRNFELRPVGQASGTGERG